MRGHEQFNDWVQRAHAVPIGSEIERRGIKLIGNGAERVGACPVCGGCDRFSINVEKNVWNCRGCKKGGGAIELVEHLDGCDFVGACTTLLGEGPPPRQADGKAGNGAKKVVTATFEYQNADGSVASVSERIQYEKPDGTFVLKDGKPAKTFRQKRPDGNGGWIFNVKGVAPIPYHLPQVIEAIAAGHPILIVEGEAKANLLWSWNIPATCNAMGAGKWRAEHSAHLSGADVILVPDNDNAGWQHVDAVGASLVGIAKRIRVLPLPYVKAKDDIIDWAKGGGTREVLDELIAAKAQDWKAKAPTADNKEKTQAQQWEDDLLTALGKAQGLDYARQLKNATKALGVDERAIKAEVRARQEAAPLHGHWIVEPWPEPVDGDSLLRDIIVRLRQHVICSLDDALAIALWIMLAWVHEGVCIHSPILNINSAEPESGKSTTLGLISFLAPRCISSVEITEAALFRSIRLWQPSFAIDEFDDVLKNPDKMALRSVINSGHTRGQGVIRCEGDDRTPTVFLTFAPKAIGMVGKGLPAATLGRCVFVELRRKKIGEKIERFQHKDDRGLTDLRRRLRRWSLDNEDTLRAASTSMPPGFDNRRADNWRVMLAIADLCSGAEDWGDKARVAAAKIETKADNRTTGARALEDARTAFSPKDDEGRPLQSLERISSADLAVQLAAYPDSPWAEFRNGKPITQAQLARLLKPFGIAPQLIRLPGGGVMRGYLRTQFEDAWERYL